MTELHNEIALVTGASRGIGRAIAETLGRAGATVVGTATSQAGAESIDAAFAAAGVCGRGVVLDVASDAGVEAACADIAGREGPITILVNNAGITRDGRMVKMTREKNWDPVIAVNLTSAFNTCNVVAPGMAERGWGRIVQISSMNGQRGQFGQSNYSATKAGVIGFNRSIAAELARNGVTCNVVSPGFILTEMTAAMPKEILDSEVKKIPCARIGQPEDIANAVAFLVDEKSGWITGETLSVNGGQLME